VSNQLAAIVTAQPGFEVSSHFEKSISNYAAAIFLSSKISAYKGSIPTNTLLNIVRKFRFDLPAGIENNPADYAKVIAAVQEAFPQLRSKFKKATNKTDKTIAPGPEHQNIFKLTQIFVDGTQCTCSVFLRDSGPKFWDKLDKSLAAIRSQAKGDAKKITRYFYYCYIILHSVNILHPHRRQMTTRRDIECFQCIQLAWKNPEEQRCQSPLWHLCFSFSHPSETKVP
ncbi:hypothetical protein B0H19DRAFT_968452, partial [Mycena capillaripes]